jgi:tRNA C32,U32 (ribose-2'-O)-methylase TrmJ
VCLYELAARGNPPQKPARETRAEPQSSSSAADAAAPASSGDPACARDLDLLARVVAETMQAANYSPRAMQKANRHDLDLLLRRLKLTRRDARRILGLFRRILWRLRL